MPITFMVPRPVRGVARRALSAHADPEQKLKDVTGISIAEALASGHVTIETVAKMHRFFAVNSKPYLEEVQQLRTVQDSATIRSWHLHGAESGRAWADRTFKKSVERGLLPADPISELMSMRPGSVYDRFSLGAWRFEYDLDPRKAARFVENYMRATGWSLDLRQAFGRSAEAVGNAIYRRFHTPDPFRQAFRALMAEDDEYHIAAQRDLGFMRRMVLPSERLVLETFKKHIFTSMNPKQAAKLVWAPFVAYFILAVEAPDILKPLNTESVKPPGVIKKPKSWKQYHDTINTYLTYFHPQGARYVDPSGDKKFVTLPEDMAFIMWQAYYGKPLVGPVQKLLGAARRWTAKNKLAGNLFHVFLADWKKGNWQHILDNIPLDADVRPYFEQFVGTNPLPKDGVKLQQTLSKKSEKAAILAYAAKEGWAKTQAVQVKTTGAHFAANEKKTPIGVYSLVVYYGKDYIYLGAWKPKNKPLQHVYRDPVSGMIHYDPDHIFSAAIKVGKLVVKQGHKDMPGTAYQQVTTAPEKVQEPPDTTKAEIEQLLKEDFPDHYQSFTEMALDDTASGTATMERFGFPLGPTLVLTDKTGSEFTFLAAYQTPEGPIIILRNPDKELIWQADDEFAGVMATGEITLKGSKSMAALDKVAQETTPEMPGVPKEAVVPPLTNKFKPMDIIDTGAPYYYLVLAFDGGMYFLARLHATTLGTVAVTFPQHSVDPSAKLIGTHVSPVVTGVDYVRIQQHHSAKEITLPAGFDPGSVVMVGDDELTFIKAFEHIALGQIVLVFEDKTTQWQGHDITYPNYKIAAFDLIGEPVESSYAPTELKPESGGEDAADVRDPETGKPHMCGTPEAVAYILKKGWLPATKPENPTFEFDLGAKLAYGPSKTRTIIGYALVPPSEPQYITMTEKGNISRKTTKAGNKAYGPIIEILTEVTVALVPKPGEAPPIFPKLNYTLRSKAKELSQKQKWVYVPAPRAAPFYVGTKVRHIESGEKYRILAWMEETKGGVPTGVLNAVLWNSAMKSWSLIDMTDLGKNYSTDFKHASVMDPVKGEMTFGKVPTEKPLTLGTTYGVNIGASPLPDGWDDPDPIQQPPMPDLPHGAHVSAGIVAIVPPTAVMSDGDTMEPSPFALLLMTHPLNDYGGYTLTYPKGTVEPGESIEHTAVREVYEETGLAVKPVGLLGDFKGNESITRFFIGYITGGLPTDAGKETDAVAFKAVPPDYQKEPWFTELKPRDQMVTDATIKWILEKGWPHLYTGDKAETHSQVTGPQDVQGQTGVVAFNPSASHINASMTGNQAATTTDYKVASHVAAWAAGPEAPFIAESTWAFVKALPLLNEGYPPPGVKVNISGVAVAATVHAYVRLVAQTGVITHAIVLEATKGISHYILFKQIQMGASKQYIFTPPKFKPVPSPVLAKTATIPADTGKHDIWRALLFKSPFPINEAMIRALRNTAEQTPFEPAVFNCSRQHETAAQPAYGQVFKSGSVALVCLGYVLVTDTAKVTHRFMFAQNQDGTYVTLPAAAGVMGNYVFSVWLHGFGNPDAWFTHPSAKTNKVIQMIYANGGNTKAVGTTMSVFTKKWMKEAGVPAWAVITKNVVQDVASLFVPGAATKPVYDAVIGALKARMKATHKGKGKVAKKMKAPVGAKPTPTGVTQAPVAAIPAWKPSMPPAKKAVAPKLPYNAAVVLQTIKNPDPGLFTSTGHVVSGGSNPNMVLTTPGGFEWFFKIPKDGDPIRIHAEIAGANLGLLVDKPTTIPVGLLEFEGKTGSLQPMVQGGPPEADPSDLPDEDKAEILSQHMLDMYMGDHDGHRGNWMRLKSGQLVPIDRGQAFKFVIKGLKESLDPKWHPKGNFGEGYAKKLLIDWGKGQAKVPEMAWKAAREMIEKISQLKDAQIGIILTPVFDAGGVSTAKRKKIIKALGKRRDNYLKDWTKVLTKLQSDFKWPKIGAVSFAAQVPELKVDPKEMGFGKAQDEEISVARANPVKGRTMKVDRDAIEQQEVMVKPCIWEYEPGKKIPATMVHFRVARPAGIKATNKLLKSSGGMPETPGAGGPQQLAVDTQNGFWDKIRKAIGNINWHLAPTSMGGMSPAPDGVLNQVHFTACFAIIPELEAVVEATKETTGTYGPMDEPNTVVNSMATMYLGYINNYIKPIHADPAKHKGTKTPTLAPFVWEPEKKGKVPEKPEARVIPKPKANKFAKWPKIVQTPEGLLVQSLQHDIHKGSKQNQFVISDTNPRYHLAINPPGMPANVPGMHKGVEGHKAISWGLIAGEPSTANIAFLFKVFEEATAISMRPATKKDQEVLFWSRQAYVHQGGGKIKPKPDGTGIVKPDYVAARALYTQGKDDEALAALQKLTAKGLGISVTEARKQAKALIPGTFDEGGVGFMRHERLGWTRAKLLKFFGKDWHIAHSLYTSLLKFFQDAEGWLTLMSHNTRPFIGASDTEASKGMDFDSGGTQGVFMAFRKGKVLQSRLLYFDMALALRTDVTVIGLGDGFGNVTYERFTTPEQWKKDTLLAGSSSTIKNRYTGPVGQSSRYQVNARHGVNLHDYLHTAICKNNAERNQILAFCQQRGWNTWGPKKRPSDKVFVLKGQEKF
jgi:8-oxo-dGTP pyrophosphatase MutT (NUDIX family)